MGTVMAYNVQSRLDRLGQRMDGINSVEVSYQQDTNTLLNTLAGTPLRASFGKGESNDRLEGMLLVRTTRQDWFFFTRDLILGDTLIKPKNGDIITNLSTNEVYVVAAEQDPDQPYLAPWNYTTPSHERIRVKTIRTTTHEASP